MDNTTPAQNKTPFALTLLGLALIFGLLADALLQVTPWGASVLLTALLLIGIIVLASRIDAPAWRLTGGGRWMLVVALVFAGVYAIRDTHVLTAFNLLAMLLALAVAGYRARAGRIRIASLADYAIALIYSSAHAGAGALVLGLADIRPGLSRARQGWMRPVVAVLTGVLLAAPLLLIFGALFASADAGFEQLLRDITRWLTEDLVTRLFLIGLWAWLAAGFLRGLFISKSTPETGASFDVGRAIGTNRPTLGAIEISVVLGLVAALFAVFVATQARYFFGGALFINDSARVLSVAEYARRGFFELTLVAALVLPLLIAAHALLRAPARAFTALALVLIGLLFVIVGSALLRMWLYVQIFGLTELRIYTTAFMLWLAFTFVWFIATTLRERANRFAFGAMIAGFATLLALNALNPLDLIVRTNVSRLNAFAPAVATGVERERQLDAQHLANLAENGDAVPALLDALPALKADDACVVAAGLLWHWQAPAGQGLLDKFDWRSLNAGRWIALQRLVPAQVELNRIACFDKYWRSRDSGD
jgi:hypothetical protein